ncbi:uncharacterized protein LOC128812745 isoform X4 [Vidua macroura]|uniref:uncharacterized protein LOC128812745 isoform X4 n=1 Tax=Vidua macroura TaxID=187451 RepID=UPI0023A84629|nr:uncharacterized protein LOC128812745 isoform X4 [Vidua macroura]
MDMGAGPRKAAEQSNQGFLFPTHVFVSLHPVPFPGSAPSANRTPCRILSSADNVSGEDGFTGALILAKAGRRTTAIRENWVTADRTSSGTLLPCASVMPTPLQCHRAGCGFLQVGSIPCLKCPLPSWCTCGIPREAQSWMLKSSGSINCRPSRGRGRQTWSRNAARAAAQPGPGGQPPATEGSLEQVPKVSRKGLGCLTSSTYGHENFPLL